MKHIIGKLSINKNGILIENGTKVKRNKKMSEPFFTKKHYKAISKMIRKNYKGCEGVSPFVKDLCNLFEKDNPNFDKEKFIRNCGF